MSLTSLKPHCSPSGCSESPHLPRPRVFPLAGPSALHVSRMALPLFLPDLLRGHSLTPCKTERHSLLPALPNQLSLVFSSPQRVYDLTCLFCLPSQGCTSLRVGTSVSLTLASPQCQHKWALQEEPWSEDGSGRTRTPASEAGPGWATGQVSHRNGARARNLEEGRVFDPMPALKALAPSSAL